MSGNAKADGFMRDAEARLAKRWNLFGDKHQDAVDLYKQAANSYKMSKNWQESGDAFQRMADCFVQMGVKHEAASAYQNAAKSYKHVSSADAVRCLSAAIEFYTEEGRFAIAAKQEKEIAEILEGDGDVEGAVEHYQTSADYYSGEGQTSAANQCRLKVADFSAQLERYQRAIELYEEIAQESLGNKLLKWGVKTYFLKAGICWMCLDDVVGAKRALQKYQDLDATFSNQRECKFLLQLLECYEGYDVDAYTIAVRDYNSITPLDNWFTNLLLRIKTTISGDTEDMT